MILNVCLDKSLPVTGQSEMGSSVGQVDILRAAQKASSPSAQSETQQTQPQ